MIKTNFWLSILSLIPFFVAAQRDSIYLRMEVNKRVISLKDTTLVLEAKDDDFRIEASNKDSIKKDFTFRLDGFDKTDNQTNKMIRYTNLHGGNYTLLVAAQDCRQRTITIQVKYTLFEEAWFEYSFLFYILLLILAVAYLWKIYDNRKKMQLAKLKNKLVADLHDDIGSSLTSIIVFTKLLQKNELPNADSKEISNDILETAQESIDNLRDIVDVMRPTKDNFYDLIEKLKNHAHKVLKANAIAVEINFDNAEKWQEKLKCSTINMKLNLNAYFIFKELINNILKHAEATKVTIDIQKVSDDIIVTVKDNGKGFDTNQAYSGFGMTTLRQRAAESFIDFELKSKMGEGTNIVMKIPIV
jgi:two-component sensor histidine kinase